MSRAIGKHFGTIRDQRQLLLDWTAYEYELEKVFGDKKHFSIVMALAGVRAGGGSRISFHGSFNHQLGDYHRVLDLAESRLKIAASIGGVVDISTTNVGNDVLCVMDAARVGTQFGSKQRIRDNLVAYDFSSASATTPRSA